jgi:hypothetical protein
MVPTVVATAAVTGVATTMLMVGVLLYLLPH